MGHRSCHWSHQLRSVPSVAVISIRVPSSRAMEVAQSPSDLPNVK